MATISRLPMHNWTKEEETTLVECLVELVNAGGWSSNNGTFRPGKSIVAAKEVFDNWVKSHPMAKGLLNRWFPRYGELLYIFGNDRTTGGRAETFSDIRFNDPTGYEGFIANAAHDIEFQTMYSYGLDISSNEVMETRTAWASEGRHVSSRPKRKRGG
ncbi:retrotransposon protein [Cucumis melo var. makuwa]|uniref:Retrotransposon protein n=1 Tax=Cucumis melo var. makuwa TaxID=1194695 RepID=A0A5D3C4N5_CUCMM|nr:retrotransposon protein [Cucumis melo var. makuwa]